MLGALTLVFGDQDAQAAQAQVAGAADLRDARGDLRDAVGAQAVGNGGDQVVVADFQAVLRDEAQVGRAVDQDVVVRAEGRRDELLHGFHGTDRVVGAARDVLHAVLHVDQPDGAGQEVHPAVPRAFGQLVDHLGRDAVEVADAAQDGARGVEGEGAVAAQQVQEQVREGLPRLVRFFPALLADQCEGGVRLRVQVEDQHAFLLHERQRVGQLDGRGGLRHAALEVDETQDVRGHQSSRIFARTASGRTV